MAKNYRFTLLVLGLTVCLCTAGSQPAVSCTKAVYTSQIGVREATGRNDGKQVEAYLKVVKASKGSSWCAAFVAWCFEQCNLKHAASAWSPSWFPANKVIWKQGKGREPGAGNVFGIWFNNKNRIAHVGFIDEWHGKYAITVEGNTNEAGSREGDGVYRKRRLTRQIYAVSNWF